MAARNSLRALEIKWDHSELTRLAKAWKGWPKIMQKATYVATVQSLALAEKHLKIYPPKMLHSTYRRTGTLGRRWTFNLHEIKQSPSKVRGSLWNTTPYAQWVQDETRQAKVHRGRWTSAQQVSRGPFLRRYIGFFKHALNRVARNLVGK